MPTNPKYPADLSADLVYHVYNRTNNKELLFRDDRNRIFFMQKFEENLFDFPEPLAWNLLSNHFHFMIRVRPESRIIKALNKRGIKGLTKTEGKFLKGKESFENLIQQAFKRFFQSYSLSFNIYHSRKGNLFYRQFKRCHVETDEQFTNTLLYIHNNAVKHGAAKNIQEHLWCSRHDLFKREKTWLLKEEVLDWFRGKYNMIRIHRYYAVFFPEPDENMDVFS